jgi:FkbM family methyltransferase
MVPFSGVIDRLKWSLEHYFMHNIYLYSLTKKLFHTLPFMLPHERDYYGLQLLLKDSSSGGLFLDVGANDGVSALSFRKINSNCAIYSLEPNPMHRRSLERLKKRLQKFDYQLCAAGDEPGRTTLTIPMLRGLPLHSASFCLPEQRKVLEADFPPAVARRLQYVTETVPVVRIDDLNLSPTVAKVDAEGYDERIIHGMQETIRRCRPILMIENNPLTRDNIARFLAPFGYSMWEYNHNQRRLFPYSGKPTRNVFFTVSKGTGI